MNYNIKKKWFAMYWIFMVVVYLEVKIAEGCSGRLYTPKNVARQYFIATKPSSIRYRCKQGYRFPSGYQVLTLRCARYKLNEMQWFPSKVDDCIPYCPGLSGCQNGGRCVLKEYMKVNISSMAFECECPQKYFGNMCQYTTCNRAPYVQNSVAVNVVNGERSKINYKYSEDSKISYICKDNYHIEGMNELTCLYRSFSPRTPPSCVANETRFNEVCPNEYKDADEYSNDLLREGEYRKRAMYDLHKDEYAAGDSVKFSCPEDSYIEGTPLERSVSISCDAKSRATWSRQWPICKKKFCHRILLRNGRVIPKSNGNQNVVGTTVTFNCSMHYYLWDRDSSNTATCLSSQLWDVKQPECITMNVFKNRCLLERERVNVRLSNGRTILSCTQTDRYSRRTNTDVNTITIVTASAAAVFGCLLVIVLIVAFQRRRLLHRIQRAHQLRVERLGEEQLYQAGPFESALQYLLPSYDEAVRSKPTTDPPTFEEAIKEVEDQSESSLNNNSLSEPSSSDAPPQLSNNNAEIRSNSAEDSPPPYPGSRRQSLEIAGETPELDDLVLSSQVFIENDSTNVVL